MSLCGEAINIQSIGQIDFMKQEAMSFRA